MPFLLRRLDSSFLSCCFSLDKKPFLWRAEHASKENDSVREKFRRAAMHIKLTNIMDMIASSSSGLGNSACHTDAILISKRVQKMLEFTNNSIIVNKSLIQKVTSKKKCTFFRFYNYVCLCGP